MDRKVKGYTVLEIVVIIAILSILASFAFLGLRNLVLKQRLKATTDSVMSILNTARIYSMTGRKGSIWGVYFKDDRTYILFEDANSNCRYDNGEDVRQFQAKAGVTISTNCGDIIVFDKKGYPRDQNCGLGACSIDLTSDECCILTLTNQAGSKRTIKISRYGRIKYETQ